MALNPTDRRQLQLTGLVAVTALAVTFPLTCASFIAQPFASWMRIDPLTTRRDVFQAVAGLEHGYTDAADVVEKVRFLSTAWTIPPPGFLNCHAPLRGRFQSR